MGFRARLAPAITELSTRANPNALKPRDPNAKVFIVLTPDGRTLKVRAESFAVSNDGKVASFSTKDGVVAIFSLANTAGVATQGVIVPNAPKAG